MVGKSGSYASTRYPDHDNPMEWIGSLAGRVSRVGSYAGLEYTGDATPPPSITGLSLSGTLVRDDIYGRDSVRITAVWDPVEYETADLPITTAADVAPVNAYAVSYDIGGGGWTADTLVTSPTVTLEHLDAVAQQVTVRVRARSATGALGPYSTSSITVTEDLIAPPVPSAPIITSVTKGVIISWDGTFVGGAAQPSDFSHVLAEYHFGDGGWTRGAELGSGGLFTLSTTGLSNVTARLSSFDITGNQSAFSATDTEAALPVFTADIYDDAINAAKIADNAVTTAAIANSAIAEAKIAAGAVTSTKIVDGAITELKIAALAIQPVHMDFDWKLNDPGSITTTHIADDAITTPKITTAAVVSEHIYANAIQSYHIVSDAISAAKIQASAVTSSEIAANAITAIKISAGAVETDKLAANAVTAVKIAAGAIEAGKIAAGAIVTADLAAGAVTAAKIAALTITASEIAAGAITTTKISAGAVDATKIQAGSIGTNELAANAVTANKIAAGAITADMVSAGTLTGSTIRTSSANQRVQITSSTDKISWYDSGGTERAFIQGVGYGGSHYLNITSNTSIFFSTGSGANVWFNNGIQVAGQIQGSGGMSLTGTLFGGVGSFSSYITSTDFYVNGWGSCYHPGNPPPSHSHPYASSSHAHNSLVDYADGVGTMGINNDGSSTRIYVDGGSQFRANNGAHVNWTGSKTFVIDHPKYKTKHLVHAAIEGPTADVFYRGIAKLDNGECIVQLPDYFEALTELEGRTVMLTPLLGCDDGCPVMEEQGGRDFVAPNLASSYVEGGQFIVKFIGGWDHRCARFFWEVKAIRSDVPQFEVEPKKSDYNMVGDGPYTYLVAK